MTLSANFLPRTIEKSVAFENPEPKHYTVTIAKMLPLADCFAIWIVCECDTRGNARPAQNSILGKPSRVLVRWVSFIARCPMARAGFLYPTFHALKLVKTSFLQISIDSLERSSKFWNVPNSREIRCEVGTNRSKYDCVTMDDRRDTGSIRK